jgi:uncharacterized protein (TIGR03067 family)
MRTHVLLVGLSVALLGFAPAPFPRPERSQRDDQADVKGLWEFIECQSGGSHYPSTMNNYNAEITGERFSFVGKNGRGSGSGYELRIDPKASPPSFTWGSANHVNWVGSYRLERDKLTLIFNSGNNVAQRPTDFSGKPQWRYVLKRIRRG